MVAVFIDGFDLNDVMLCQVEAMYENNSLAKFEFPLN